MHAMLLLTNKPAIEVLQRNDEIEHYSIRYNSINHTKSDEPSGFSDVDFSLNPNQNKHRAPRKSLNDQ